MIYKYLIKSSKAIDYIYIYDFKIGLQNNFQRKKRDDSQIQASNIFNFSGTPVNSNPE